MNLVTGATGFVGRHLVRRLIADGQRVCCLVRSTSDLSVLPTGDIRLVTADLMDGAALVNTINNCDVVYHLAARTSATCRSDLFRTNAMGCRTVAAACASVARSRSSASPVLVLVSSIAAAGTAIAGRSRRVTDPARPVSEYGRSKLAGEYAASFFADRVPISIVRPGIVLGVDSHELQPLYESISRFRIHAVPGYLPRHFAMIHIDDLVEVLLRVAKMGRRIARPQMSAEAQGTISNGDECGYYIAATEAPTYADLGRMIGRAVGVGQPLVLPIPELLAWLAAGGVELVNRVKGTSESFNLDKMREAFAGDWLSVTESLKRDLGFSPPFSLQQRLADLRPRPDAPESLLRQRGNAR